MYSINVFDNSGYDNVVDKSFRTLKNAQKYCDDKINRWIKGYPHNQYTVTDWKTFEDGIERSITNQIGYTYTFFIYEDY